MLIVLATVALAQCGGVAANLRSNRNYAAGVSLQCVCCLQVPHAAVTHDLLGTHLQTGARSRSLRLLV